MDIKIRHLINRPRQRKKKIKRKYIINKAIIVKKKEKTWIKFIGLLEDMKKLAKCLIEKDGENNLSDVKL